MRIERLGASRIGKMHGAMLSWLDAVDDGPISRPVGGVGEPYAPPATLASDAHAALFRAGLERSAVRRSTTVLRIPSIKATMRLLHDHRLPLPEEITA